MKKSRKIVILILALLLTVNYSVFAEIPDNTVVIGDKAYDLSYANEKENYLEIIDQLKKHQPIYVKAANGTWYDNKTLSIISNQFIPRVTYKDAEGNLEDYVKMDGEKIILKVLTYNFISNNQIQIKFNNKLNKEIALNKTNYTINEKILGENDAINLSEDLQTIIITLNENIKDNDEISILISDKIKDLNNNLIKGNTKIVYTNKKNNSNRGHSHNSDRKHSHNNDDIIEVDKVTLDKTKVSLNVGEKIKLNASVIPSNADNKSLSWSTENKGIVSVEDGEITALKEGKEIVRVTSNNGKYAECEINVVRIKTQINVEGEKATIILEGSLVKDKIITIKIINVANNSIEDVEQINRTDKKCEYLSKLDSGEYYAQINISGVGKIETNKFTICE